MIATRKALIPYGHSNIVDYWTISILSTVSNSFSEQTGSSSAKLFRHPLQSLVTILMMTIWGTKHINVLYTACWTRRYRRIVRKSPELDFRMLFERLSYSEWSRARCGTQDSEEPHTRVHGPKHRRGKDSETLEETLA